MRRLTPDVASAGGRFNRIRPLNAAIAIGMAALLCLVLSS